MADQETIPIGLETQNKVAEAIYLRWYRNGRRHPRPWNEMAMQDKEPWRRGMGRIRSCRSVTSWSRRICTPAICAAGGVQVPSIP